MTDEQHTSRPYINLDWADVEAWVKSNPRTTKNWRGGYNTACPVLTHEPPNQRLSVWDSEDDRVALKCWGGCEYWDVLAAIDKAIKTSVSPDSEPQPTAEARTEELDKTLAATKAELDQQRDARSVAEARTEELDKTLAATIAELDQERADRSAAEARTEELEQTLAVTKTELDQERDARSAAEARIKGFRGATKRARKEERDALASDIRGLREDLAAARDREKQQAKSLVSRDSRIKELEEDLVESKRKVLTFDFLEAWSELEDKLKSLNRELIQDGQKTDVANQLRRVYEKESISKHQFMNLETMRVQRNDIVHSALLLTTSQARANLGILKQVIGQL